MKKDNFRMNVLFAWIIIFYLASFSHLPSLLASGHGCAAQEADRDGDGVPDRTDEFPDDPSRTAQDEGGDPQSIPV